MASPDKTPLEPNFCIRPRFIGNGMWPQYRRGDNVICLCGKRSCRDYLEVKARG